jgi:LPS-assembly lipoprotein
MVIAALAGGCGFRPLYATDTVLADDAEPATREQLAATVVGPIADRPGQILRNELVFLLAATGEAAAPRYSLNVTLSESLSTIAVQITGLATRANLRLYASYVLTDLATGQTAMQGWAEAVGSYDLLPNEFATLIASRYTREQAARRLARILHTRLATFYGTRKLAAGGADAGEAETKEAGAPEGDTRGADAQAAGAPEADAGGADAEGVAD